MEHQVKSDRSDEGPKSWPTLSDVKLGGLFGAAWALAIIPKAPTNPGWGNLSILLVYLLAYTAFWALCHVALRVVFQKLAGFRKGLGFMAWALPIALLVGINVALLIPAFNKGLPVGYWQGAVAALVVLGGSAIPLLRHRWISRLAWVALPLSFVVLSQPVIERNREKESLDLASVPLGYSPFTVRLLGIDGTDLGLIKRLMKEGVPLPNFERLMKGGVSGKLRTISPHSPVVWTSIATGRKPKDHGVLTYSTAYFRAIGLSVPNLEVDFIGTTLNDIFQYNDVGGISSTERNVKAIWEILTDFKRSTLMINWWASFPAEPVEGMVISNHTVPWGTFEAEAVDALSHISHLVYPPEIQEEVIESVQNFVEEQKLGELRRDAFSVAGWSYFKARDDIMVSLYDKYWSEEHQLSTVYLQGIDTASHAYSTILFGYNKNKKRPMKVSQEEADRWWQALVVESYLRMDRLIGVYLDGLQPNENLMVVSDHGWRYDGTSHWGRPAGVFMAYGPAFRAGYLVRGATVYDVLPTLATLLAVPISAELEGKSLGQVFSEEAGLQTPATIPGYGQREQDLKTAKPESMDDGHIERLKALGYVD